MVNLRNGSSRRRCLGSSQWTATQNLWPKATRAPATWDIRHPCLHTLLRSHFTVRLPFLISLQTMSAAMLSSSLASTPARFGAAKRQPCRRKQPVCASYRPGSGFNATDAFQQAARQFAQFQQQQQRATSQQRPQNRGDSSKTEAFREGYGPFQWNFDSEQVSNFMKEVDKAFGGDGSSMPSADSMQDVATSLRFPVDIRESSTEYKYLVDLPGVPKSDIKVSLITFRCWTLLFCSHFLQPLAFTHCTARNVLCATCP